MTTHSAALPTPAARRVRPARPVRKANATERKNAAIALACRLALGEATCHDRFRFAWDSASPGLGTLGGFAKQLGTNGSSLTRTNFKLNAERRRAAADALGVPVGFLAQGNVSAKDLPTALGAPFQIATGILALARRPGQSQATTWTREAALIGLQPAALYTALNDHDPRLITAVHRALANDAAAKLTRHSTITLPLADWSTIIDLLVNVSLNEAPGNLLHRHLQLARLLHECLTDEERP